MSSSSRTTNSGYALPAVLMLSTALLIMGLAIAQSSLAIRQALLNQYYTHLASEAAQAGVIYAQDCITNNGGIAPWPTAPSPSLHVLTPYTDCTGTPLCTLPAAATPPIGIPQQCSYKQAYVISQGNIRTSYTVPAPDANGRLQVAGATNLLAANTSTIARTYGQTVAGVTSAAALLNSVAFGYWGQYNSPGSYTLAGYFFALAPGGAVYGLGDNSYGQRGTGNYTSQLTPTNFILPAGVTAVSVSTNFVSAGYNSFVVGSDGKVYGAGYNGYGQLGDGTTTTYRAMPVPMLLPGGTAVASITVNGFNTYILTTTGVVYALGDCTNGSTGDGSSGSGCIKSTPTRVQVPAGETVTKVVTDGASAELLTASGKVYGIGANYYGMLGNGSTTNAALPVLFGSFGIGSQPRATDVVTDGGSTWILASDGNVYGSGRNDVGQLGIGSTVQRTSPVRFNLPFGLTGRALATDQFNISVIASNGKVYSAGRNDQGQAGNGIVSGSSANVTPVIFNLPAGVTATKLWTTDYGYVNDGEGFNDTFVIGSDGNVYGAGANVYGQLGNGTTGATVPTPAEMQLPSGITALDIQSGAGTTVVLGSDHKIYTVGNNQNGQLGDGTTTNSSIPTTTQYVNIRPLIVF